MSSGIYRGFSTYNWIKHRTFDLIDIDLVKRDLLNHIFTIRGERVMMPGFGTRIPVITFEPNDQRTLSIIETDLREVFEYDPRVNLIDLQVLAAPNNNMIVALADLFYVEFNVRDVLRIEIPTQ